MKLLNKDIIFYPVDELNLQNPIVFSIDDSKDIENVSIIMKLQLQPGFIKIINMQEQQHIH